jgi:hypothetical protein
MLRFELNVGVLGNQQFQSTANTLLKFDNHVLFLDRKIGLRWTEWCTQTSKQAGLDHLKHDQAGAQDINGLFRGLKSA